MARLAAAALVALALVAGCSSSAEEAAPPATTVRAEPPPATSAASPPAATAVEGTTDRQTMESVVRAWSAALNSGDNDAVARLFSLPAVLAQAGQVGEFRTYGELADWFSGLPCSGTVVSVAFDEPDVALAVFELGDRTGTSPCDAPAGSRAAARFVFRDGKLVAWQQVPVSGEEVPQTTGGNGIEA